MTEAEIFPQRIAALAMRQGERTALTFVPGSGAPRTTSYAQLVARAASVARFLAEHTARGDAVIVTVAELDAFCAGFLGIVAAGRVAVPVYPPLAPSEAERTRTVIQATGARHLLCTADQLGSLERLRDEFQLTLHPVDRLEEGGDLPAPPAPDEVAFLQFTSGSTGSPKGIVVTHRQLAEHLEAATGHSSVTADDVFCSWLPIFHDMGLVWMTLQPLWNGAHAVGMLPVTFIREPWRWLQVLSEYGATVTASPNFGYDLAVRKCAGRSLAGLDLRRVRIALNAAERVWPATLRAFHARFEEVGLASTALSAGYGLAEVIVAVCITRHGAAPRTLRVSRDALESDGV
ncbi:MAG TPA: AMP-binding protein, partial [Archangium sp.]